MINLAKLTDFDLINKRVIVRLDLDIAEGDTTRIDAAIPTIKYLFENNAKVIVIGHKGRPKSSDDKAESLEFLKPILEKKFETVENGVFFVSSNITEVAIASSQSLRSKEILLVDNLRFQPGEEANDIEFAKKLASLGEFYVNEAFGVSHRAHASIVGLPKLLPHAAGFRFIQEVENLSRVFENPKRPVISLISGVKDDKLSYIDKFLQFSDKILIGGRLPEYIHDTSPLRKNSKVVVADLVADKEDITIHSMEKFEEELVGTQTIVVSGPMGMFEDEGHRQGTKRVLTAVSNLSAFKIAGGADTTAAIDLLGLVDKFDWISVGGGAMLDFLANGTLAGIEALSN